MEPNQLAVNALLITVVTTAGTPWTLDTSESTKLKPPYRCRGYNITVHGHRYFLKVCRQVLNHTYVNLECILLAASTPEPVSPIAVGSPAASSSVVSLPSSESLVYLSRRTPDQQQFADITFRNIERVRTCT